MPYNFNMFKLFLLCMDRILLYTSLLSTTLIHMGFSEVALQISDNFQRCNIYFNVSEIKWNDEISFSIGNVGLWVMTSSLFKSCWPKNMNLSLNNYDNSKSSLEQNSSHKPFTAMMSITDITSHGKLFKQTSKTPGWPCKCDNGVFAHHTLTKTQEWLLARVFWTFHVHSLPGSDGVIRDSLVGYCGWWTQGHWGQESPECNVLREPRIKGKPDVMEARAVVEAVLSLPHCLVNRVLCCHSLVRSQ